MKFLIRFSDSGMGVIFAFLIGSVLMLIAANAGSPLDNNCFKPFKPSYILIWWDSTIMRHVCLLGLEEAKLAVIWLFVHSRFISSQITAYRKKA